jgi:rhamnosyltransferase
VAEERSAPDIEVIVLCKNEGESLGPCLETVLGQEDAGSFSVSVIDSGSTDGSVELIRSLPVRLIEIAPSEFHHARTRNLGAERTLAPIIVYTNGHVLPARKRWLARLTAPLREDPRGKLAGVYGRQIARADAYPMERFMLDHLYGHAPRVQRVVPGQPVTLAQTMFSTANCALRRDLWLERPFSDQVQMSEDQEWSRYWIERGYAIVYEPEAAVIHSHNNSLSGAFRRYYGLGASSEYSYVPREGRTSVEFMLSSLRYQANEVAYLVREGHSRWLPHAAMYESVKIAGWVLGRQRAWVPRALRQRLERLDTPRVGI